LSTPAALTLWHRLDLWLARLRPHREPLSLLVDGLVIALCWNITYLFRLGFERWISARPGYDIWVMLGVIACYLLAFTLLRVPQSMWRFAGFGEIKRLTVACLLAGICAAAVVMGLGLSKVPRAVLALHPVVALMGVSLARIAYRMVYEHARARIAGGQGEVRRALVLGAGQAARMLLAGLHHQGWVVLGLLDDDPDKHGRAHRRRARAGPAGDAGRQTHLGQCHARGHCHAGGYAPAKAPCTGIGRRHGSARADRAQRRRTAHRPDAGGTPA
jgi:hypothetical protein